MTCDYICWYLMIHGDTWWYVMLVMICDDIWGDMMIYESMWWYLMLYDDKGWYVMFVMICDDTWAYLMITDNVMIFDDI